MTYRLIVMKFQRACGFRHRMKMPMRLPNKTMNGMGLGQEIAGELYILTRKFEPAFMNTTAKRQHREAGQIRLSRCRTHKRLIVTLEADDTATRAGHHQFRRATPQRDGFGHERYFIL